MNNALGEYVFSFLFSKHSGMRFVDHAVSICLSSYETVKDSSKVLGFFAFPQVMCEHCSGTTTLPAFCIVVLKIFIIAILVDLQWYSIMALIFISLLTNDFEHLSCAYLTIYEYDVYLSLLRGSFVVYNIFWYTYPPPFHILWYYNGIVSLYRKFQIFICSIHKYN